MSGTAESSWLLSALLQSGAAITAIAGGLLGSRYVAEQGNQTSAAFQVEKAKRDERNVDRKVRRLQSRVEDLRRMRFTSRPAIMEAVVRGDVPEREISRFVGRAGDDALEAVRNDVRDQIRRADEIRRELEDVVDLKQEIEPWPKVRSRLVERASRMPRLLHEWVYLDMARRHKDRSLDHAVAYSNLEDEVADRAARLDESRRENWTSVMSQLREARVERDAAWESRRDAENALQHMRRSEGFRLGLSVLASMALLTMAPAAALLVASRQYYPIWALGACALAFAVGLFLLYRFMVAYSKYLSGTTDALPTAPLTLLPFAWKRWLGAHLVPDEPSSEDGDTRRVASIAGHLN